MSALSRLNHFSLVVKDVEATAAFYCDLLGFEPIRRPGVLEERFHGAWLHGPGNLGIHLIAGQPPQRSAILDPKTDHWSFETEDIALVEANLKSAGVEYVRQVFVEDQCLVTQLFFHDPEHHMCEVCTCDVLPIVRLADVACPTCPSQALSDAMSDGSDTCMLTTLGDLERASTSTASSSDHCTALLASLCAVSASLLPPIHMLGASTSGRGGHELAKAAHDNQHPAHSQQLAVERWDVSAGLGGFGTRASPCAAPAR